MRITFLVGEAEIDVDVALRGTEQTVAEVVTALADGPVADGVGLLVDGRFVPPSATVTEAGLREGAMVELAGSARPAASRDALVELRVVGGLLGGQRHGLG